MQVNKDTYNRNYNQHELNIPRAGLPNGGGFTIARFTLNALWEQHELARNVWTKSNKNMPLFRYTGCTIKVYRPMYTDLVVKFQTCYPMCCSKLMYTGSQPSLMMMSKGSKKIRCKLNAPNAKPYKKFKLKPPQQMTNKWYFQATESNTGLLLINAAAASFDQYYISKHSESNTITLHSLNTKIFQNMNFKNPPTYGYIPKPGFALYASNGEDKIKDLIWLGNAVDYNKGKHIMDITEGSLTPAQNWANKVKKYMENKQNWGNPFHHHYLSKSAKLWFGKTNPLLQLISNGTKQLTGESSMSDAGLREVDQELYFDIRYNVNKDKGYESNIYILPNWKDNEDLEPLPDETLQNPGFPAWLSGFGFVDYLQKLGTKSQIPTHYLLVHKSNYMDPKLPHYIFIDTWFVEGNSQFLQGLTDWDNVNWYPMITHQDSSMNTLALAGPGAPKLGDVKTIECKIEYQFYFKIGGCAPPIEKLADPSTQPTYTTPSNIIDTNSLQSPEEPIETNLYQFDWRRHQITQKAADRISKDYGTKKYLFTDGGGNATEVPLQQAYEKELLTSEEEEAQEETLFEQLQLQRNKQKQLRLRIKQLLTKMQNI